MKGCALLVVLLLIPLASARGEDNISDATALIERYLAMPTFDMTTFGDQARFLAELKTMPNGAVAAAEKVLFDRANSKQRRMIVGALGDHIHTGDCARLLIRVLQEPLKHMDEESARWEGLVRDAAVLGIRKMAARVHLSGPKREVFAPESEPQVQGLVPYLISAANDEAESVRISALLGLADTRDPLAQAELKNRLKDPSPAVQFNAACLLTEFKDNSGLPELRRSVAYALERWPKPDGIQVEMLLASLERITGKSFGEIPNSLTGDIDFRTGQSTATLKYKELLLKWQAWFNEK
jgi:hypothetical protein